MRLHGLQSVGQTVHLSPRAGRGRIALAIRLRGTRRKRGSNGFEHPRYVPQHVVVPEPQNSVIVIEKPLVANHIARVVGVMPSIHLNNKTTFTANKVDRVGTNRLLPNKFVAIQPARPEEVPQSGFSFGASFSQAPGASGFDLIRRSHVETPPHPDCFAIQPLPASGERLPPRISP